MATFCLTKQTIEKFKKALKDREIDPIAMAEMTSEQRRTLLEKYVGEHAKDVNALYESKLLLKNQQAGYISWIKKVAGMSPEVKRDLISKIQRFDKVLAPDEEKAFLQDLASKRLGLDINEADARAISELSNKVSELEKKANSDGIFPSQEDRLAYGMAKVNLEKYVNDLKLKARKISFREQPVQKLLSIPKGAPGFIKSFVLSLDNSFWGKQGIKTLLDPATSHIWIKNFLKSWVDFGKGTLKMDPIDAIRADIYSRPNALNGKYKAGDYGLNVLTEEAYPSSLPEKIPLLGRLFRASEAAYNGGALRMRADLADRLIRVAEKTGINTLSREEAQGMGHLVSSITGRGSISSLTPSGQAKANVIFTSIKFLKSNIDTLTAHQFDTKSTSFTRKQARLNLVRMLGTLVTIFTIAKMLDPKSVDEDPRSKNFGKVKIFGHWTDITGGMASLVTLASQLSPTMHDGELGFWSKSKNGEYTNLGTKYGLPNALDIFEQFFEGKLSPIAGVLRDVWKRKTYSGQDVTIKTELFNQTPLSIQQFNAFMKDPDSSNILGSMLLETIGFSSNTSAPTNEKTGLIPTNKKLNERTLLDSIDIYSKAIGTDPETAFNRIFTGQKIMQVSDGGIIVVSRQDVADSEAFKKKWVQDHGGKVSDIKEMRLDHTIPNKLGGEEKPSNWKIVPKSLWSSYTPVETALIRAVKKKKVPLKEAQRLIVKFKGIEDKKERDTYGMKIRNKYK